MTIRQQKPGQSSPDPTAARIARVKELAAKATPGPRIYILDGVWAGQILAIDGERMTHLTDTPELDDRPDDMEFIAALDPAFVLELCARAERLAEAESPEGG